MTIYVFDAVLRYQDTGSEAIQYSPVMPDLAETSGTVVPLPRKLSTLTGRPHFLPQVRSRIPCRDWQMCLIVSYEARSLKAIGRAISNPNESRRQ